MAQQYFADDLLLRLGYDPRDSILETKDLSSDLSALDTAFVASVDEQVEVWSNTPSKLSGNSETKETNTTSAFEKPETCKEKRKVGLGRPKGNAKSNAERCTEYRNRKRREEEQVYSDNLSLKRERKELLCTIADLENMVQAMQGEGYIDLTLENELLRKEIKRHRQFIDRVVDLAGDDGVGCLEDEKLRWIKSGVENCVGQMIGLLYASTTDNSWREVKPRRFMLCEEEGFEAELRCYYQFLPLDVSPKDVTRVNVRTDVIVPLHASLWVQVYEDVSRNIPELLACLNSLNPGHDVRLEELLPYQYLPEREEAVRCLRVTASKQGSDRTKQELSVSGSRMVQLQEGAVPEEWLHSEETFPVQLKLFTSSSCNLKPLEDLYPAQSPAERAQEMLLNCAMFRPISENLTRAISIASCPTTGGVFEVEQQDWEHDGSLFLGGMDVAAAEWTKYYKEVRRKAKG